MAESQQRWQVLGRWRGNWPWWPLGTAALVGLAGVVWWRWGLTGVAIACGIAVVGWLVVRAVVMADRLPPPVPAETLDKMTDEKARLDAIDARTRLRHDLRNGPLQWLTVLAVLVGAGLGFQQLAEDRDQARQDRQLTRQGQASERFTRAIDQLGSSRVETRIGGIYGLDQIAEQSPENTGPVGEVLLAWLNGRPRPRPRTALYYAPLREHAPDVQAALSVLVGQQRYSSTVADRLDLHGLGLLGADLHEANLSHADLHEANLSHADLRGANLRFASLFHADLAGADLRGADLFGATLRGADLSGASLGGADLRFASLDGANLSHADLSAADLRRASLDGANLGDATADGTTRWPARFDWRSAGVRVVP